MNDQQKIKNVSITLYPFHLRTDFGRGFQETAANASQIWEKLADIGKTLKIPALEKLRDSLLCYENGEYSPERENAESLEHLSEKEIEFKIDAFWQDRPLEGSILPSRFQDSYTADLTFFYSDSPIPVADLQCFNPKNCLLPASLEPSIGQTILIYGEPVVYDGYRQLADACIASFVGKKLPYRNQGHVFGSPIFEYSNSELDPSQACHILVWLQDDPKTLDSVDDNFNYFLQRLLFYRSKVRFSYYKAGQTYEEGEKLEVAIEGKKADFNAIDRETDPEKRLKLLKDLLSDLRKNLFDYTACLRDLRDRQTTIATNIDNYESTLASLRQAIGEKYAVETDSLALFEDFLGLAREKYEPQILIYLNYLSASQSIFQEAIAMIRGMVEIEQVEFDRSSEANEKQRDKQLQNIVFFVGTAVGVGGIAATSYPLISKENPIVAPWHREADGLHPFVSSLLVSSAMGAIALLVVGLVLGLLRAYRRIISGSQLLEARSQSSEENKT